MRGGREVHVLYNWLSWVLSFVYTVLNVLPELTMMHGPYTGLLLFHNRFSFLFKTSRRNDDDVDQRHFLFVVLCYHDHDAISNSFLYFQRRHK